MILVIGGSGRLGRLVVEGVAAGQEVRVLAPHATASRRTLPDSTLLVNGDVRDPAAVATAADAASCIVVASHGVENRERDGLRSVDELGSSAVVSAAQRLGCSIVLVSMVGAARKATLPLARAKWAAEQVVRQSGVPWTIVRAAAFAQTWAMILTLSAGRSGRPAIIGPGEATHRFVDVRDVAAVVVRAATDESLRGRIIEVSGPDELSVTQLAAMVQEANSWVGPPRHLPLPLARAIAPCIGLFRPDLGRRVLIGIAMNHPQHSDSHDVHVPPWVETRPITSQTMGRYDGNPPEAVGRTPAEIT
jgi:uncharacterized protein YbjT (DUF2867 family)